MPMKHGFTVVACWPTLSHNLYCSLRIGKQAVIDRPLSRPSLLLGCETEAVSSAPHPMTVISARASWAFLRDLDRFSGAVPRDQRIRPLAGGVRQQSSVVESKSRKQRLHAHRGVAWPGSTSGNRHHPKIEPFDMRFPVESESCNCRDAGMRI